MPPRPRERHRSVLSFRSLLRGVAYQSQLTFLARAGGRPSVQRWFADRSVAATLRWSAPARDPAADLHTAEESIWSQNGEDGLLAALLERTGAPARSFAEIGAADGRENCTRALAERGAHGFWFEADADKVQRARELSSEFDLHLDVQHASVTPANVATLMRRTGVPSEPDVLVLDIDGNDFWVLRSLLREVTPRILVVEYNAAFPPGVFWTRRPRRRTTWDETYRHGASLDALEWLCARAGYRLVACDSTGVNAFFVRTDVADRAGLVRQPTDLLYRPLRFAQPALGHPYRVEVACPALTEVDRRRIRISQATFVGRRGRDRTAPQRLYGVRARIENETRYRLTSTGSTPLRLSGHLIDARGDTVVFEMERNWVHGGIPARGHAWAGGVFRVDDERAETLRLCLVQDGVAWLESGAFDLPVPG